MEPKTLDQYKKPSHLIRVAVEDNEVISRDPRYVIDMETWHQPGRGKPCAVCFAGCVMARRLGIKGSKQISLFYDFSVSDSCKLYSLEYFRRGQLRRGFLTFYKDLSFSSDTLPEHIDVPEYGGKGIRFRRAMLKLADMLEEAGY